MKKRFFAKNLLTVISLILLVATLALSTVSCGKEGNDEKDTSETMSEAVGTEIGDGDTTFTFKVKFKDSSERTYTVSTDKETVGEALLDVGLIDGDQGDFGIYVKTVAGETLDYNTDKMYWAFYENGKYALKGAELTTIDESVVYSFEAAS